MAMPAAGKVEVIVSELKAALHGHAGVGVRMGEGFRPRVSGFSWGSGCMVYRDGRFNPYQSGRQCGAWNPTKCAE